MLTSVFDASVWIALAAATVAAVASIRFLRTRDFLYDSLALSATETGVVLAAVGIVSGVIAGHAATGFWWTWDARITTALVGFLLYAPYLMLRSAIEEPTRRAASAAVVSILTIFDLPIIALAVNWWLARRVSAAPIGVGWMIVPLGVLGTGLTWVRLGREQRRRAQDAERRATQEI